MQTYKDLIQQKAELEKRIAEARATEAKEALAKVHDLVHSFGFTAQQVFPWQPTKKKVPAKYIDPATGSTWTGRGKPPHWIAGKDRAQFEVKVKISEPTPTPSADNVGNNPFPVR